jgi:hypothetical protein
MGHCLFDISDDGNLHVPQAALLAWRLDPCQMHLPLHQRHLHSLVSETDTCDGAHSYMIFKYIGLEF